MRTLTPPIPRFLLSSRATAPRRAGTRRGRGAPWRPGAGTHVLAAAAALLLLAVPGAAQEGPAGAGAADVAAQGPLRLAPSPENVTRDPALFDALRYRMVGPHRGGRVTAVTGYPDDPVHYLMGTVGGGVWETTDAGETWQNLTDGFLQVGPVGAVEVAPSDPNVIYVGTGSGGVRGNVSTGKGVYRSTDAGATWSWVGLPEAGQIHKIVVHPEDPELVYVAALGHVFGPNPERGVYRSTDGGDTWEKVLFVSDSTGAIEVVMSPRNPRVLYAAMWRAERKPWTMISGSRDGGVFRTTDGGDSWTKLTRGLPEMVGRIGIDVSPANPHRVYALVEAEGDLRGLYRSDDAGASFEMVSGDRNLMARPWYYMHVTADPADEDVVYVNNEDFYRSVDGGRSWEEIDTPHGDNHDMWINPRHPEIFVQANDGGANVTFNGGETWSTQLNQPTAEFYTVVTDDGFPYRLYAPQQDNSTISLPSRVMKGITPTENWHSVAGGETGPIAVDPRNPAVTYGGSKGRISRHDARTDQERMIWVWPLEFHARANTEFRYRRQWNSQIEISPHDPDVVYHGSQFVHRTTDAGETWEVVSPDLTRFEEYRETQTTIPGGPLTHDQTGVEIYGTIFALEASPHERGVIWAGSDDGAIHVTRDGGDTWTDVTPEGLPLHSTVNEIVPSPHAAGRAFAAVHRYRMDDFRPMIYRTNDYGASWELLTDGTNGIPGDFPTRTIQEDPVRRGLLYAGTEFGLFVSFDDGVHWQPFQLNLPRTPVMDLEVKGSDLVVATQGRALWVLDDLSPLRELDGSVAAEPAHLFRPRDTYRQRLAYGGRGRDPSRWPENPPEGAMIFFHLAEQPAGRVAVEITGPDGETVKRYTTAAARDAGGASGAGSARAAPDPRNRLGPYPLEAGAGTNRLVWDLKYPPAYLAPGVHETTRGEQPVTGYTGGPYAVPGSYTATLSVEGAGSQSRSFEVLPDPRLEGEVTVADMRASFEMEVEVRDRISEIQRVVAALQSALEDLHRIREKVAEPGLREVAAALEEEIDAAAGELYKHELVGDHAHHHPELTTDYARVYTMLHASDHRPPAVARERLEELDGEFRQHVGRARALLEERVPELNRRLREAGYGPVLVGAR